MRDNGYFFHKDLCTFMIISHSVNVGNVSEENCRENWNICFVCKIFFFEMYRLWDYLEEYGTSGQATDDNMAHARFMLDNQVYRHKLRICNIYWFLHGDNCYANAPQCYFICTLPVLWYFDSVCSQVNCECLLLLYTLSRLTVPLVHRQFLRRPKAPPKNT